jgi:hypothetical protein
MAVWWNWRAQSFSLFCQRSWWLKWHVVKSKLGHFKLPESCFLCQQIKIGTILQIPTWRHMGCPNWHGPRSGEKVPTNGSERS